MPSQKNVTNKKDNYIFVKQQIKNNPEVIDTININNITLSREEINEINKALGHNHAKPKNCYE